MLYQVMIFFLLINISLIYYISIILSNILDIIVKYNNINELENKENKENNYNWKNLFTNNINELENKENNYNWKNLFTNKLNENLTIELINNCIEFFTHTNIEKNNLNIKNNELLNNNNIYTITDNNIICELLKKIGIPHFLLYNIKNVKLSIQFLLYENIIQINFIAHSIMTLNIKLNLKKQFNLITKFGLKVNFKTNLVKNNTKKLILTSIIYKFNSDIKYIIISEFNKKDNNIIESNIKIIDNLTNDNKGQIIKLTS